MIEILVALVAGLLLIAAATSLGRRLRVAPPLVLTAVGVVLALLPFVPNVEIEPEWILVAVLPPLLYSAAVSMPPMEFRRALSLLIQGGTLGALVRWIRPATADPQHAREEQERLIHLLEGVELEPAERSWKQERLALIEARRRLLLDARDDGTFDAAALEAALVSLDAEQISLELQGGPRE